MVAAVSGTLTRVSYKTEQLKKRIELLKIVEH
jgi:hypothetical protein